MHGALDKPLWTPRRLSNPPAAERDGAEAAHTHKAGLGNLMGCSVEPPMQSALSVCLFYLKTCSLSIFSTAALTSPDFAFAKSIPAQ